MIEKVIHKKKLFALIIKGNFKKKRGITFFTKKNLPQQLGYMRHPVGHIIKPHRHKKKISINLLTTEVLIILKGKLRVDFYNSNNKKNYLFSKILKTKDIIYLVDGAHGFKVLKEVQMFEIKQGPYDNLQDKYKFSEVSEEKIKLKKL